MRRNPYAHACLLTGIFCYLQIFGIEKALLTCIFGALALRGAKEKITSEDRRRIFVGFSLAGANILFVAWSMHQLFQQPPDALVGEFCKSYTVRDTGEQQ